MSIENKDQQNINEVLGSSDKDMQSTTGILSRLWRIVLADLSIGIMAYNNLMRKWLDDPTNGIAQNSKDRLTERGNVNRALFKNDMTFNTLIKGFRLLRVTKLKITIELTRDVPNAPVTEHSITIENLPAFVKKRQSRG